MAIPNIPQNSYQLSNRFKQKKYLKYAYGGDPFADLNNNGANNGLNIRDNQGVPAGQQPNVNTPKTSGPTSGQIGAIAAGTSSIGDAINEGSPRGQTIGGSALKGAASGAALGTAILPGWGTAVGAVVGGATGAVSGAVKKQQYLTNASNIASRIEAQKKQQMNDYILSNPETVQGDPNAQYFATGGTMPLATNFMAAQQTVGGNMTQQSSDGTQITGNSHDAGGVKIPALNAEVEHGETTKDNYVFSKALGFADLHKPIMRAKGKIEMKPFTTERANSIKLLNRQEDRLQLAQEFAKSQMGLSNDSGTTYTDSPKTMFPDGGTIETGPNQVDVATPSNDVNTPIVNNQGRRAWNTYVDYLKTKNLSGNANLDKNGYGYQVLNDYMKSNPNSGLTPQNVTPIQKDMQNYRSWALQSVKNGTMAFDQGTNENNFMSALSKVDGYPGSLTTKHQFPSAYLDSYDKDGRLTVLNKGNATQQTQIYRKNGGPLYNRFKSKN